MWLAAQYGQHAQDALGHGCKEATKLETLQTAVQYGWQFNEASIDMNQDNGNDSFGGLQKAESNGCAYFQVHVIWRCNILKQSKI